MDVLTTVRNCLSKWTKGGESECRNILIAPHCNPSDSRCLDVLTTTYHTLLAATLTTWSPVPLLTPVDFATFVRSVLRALPSSSVSSSTSSTNATIFGEHLVDMIWSVDAELDEILSDAKSVIAANAEIQSSELAMASTAKQHGEEDKQRLYAVVKNLLAYEIITSHCCRERLDSSVLAAVSIIPDKMMLDKKEIRTRTGLFYKQNKFNLLREQSEGYSKLTVELTNSLGPPHSASTGYPTEEFAVIEERARPVWEKVTSLIGYFDLDPNRALDIILDVLSVHLATHYTFFLALLSCSPWVGSYRRPANAADDIKIDIPLGSYRGKTLDEVLELAEQTSSKAPFRGKSGPRVLAQVLGFKFSYYNSPDVVDSTPKSLFLVAALLIREGFISLEDLYSHLIPVDEDMDAFRKSYMADVQSRISGAKISQLAMAAPLESGGNTSQTKVKASTPAEPKQSDVKDANQKVGLLSALLAVGAIKPALAILSKFPWLVDVHPELADLMIRILKLSLSPLYDSLITTKEKKHIFTQPRARYGATGVVQAVARKPQLTLWAPTPPGTSTTDFVFFFPNWADRIPICSTLEDLEDVIEPLMQFIGLHVSRDTLFLTKFLRLGRLHLQSTIPIDPETKKPTGEPDPESSIRKFWFRILRRFLLPALPLIRGNAVCTVEVWNIIRQYETTMRWRLYGEWKTTVYKSHPELRIREVQADRESKGILRRLSHNTIDSLAGTVAKLAHSNPCIFFSNAVNQIMAYDNLANVVIQALRYVTNMGFDVLVFVILDAFANPAKDRVKDDGVNTSDWLQSLASFTGMLFRRYSADISPVLKYIVHQLHNGQTTEIIVLRELIWKMAGIEPLPSLSESQIAAMAGGPILRIEAVASTTRGARLDPGDAVLKGPQRLGKSLLESSLALPLLIQVAQQRQACVYKAPDAHLKSLASLYDTTHGVLLQYLELLTSPSVVSSQDYANKVLPSLAELGETYGICAPICMQIIRPVLHTALLSCALEMQEQERVASEEAEKRLKAALTAKREPTTSRLSSPAVGNNSPPEPLAEVKEETSGHDDTQMEVDTTTTVAPTVPESPWLPQLSALFDDVKKIAPGNAYEVIGPGFYLTFWQLSSYDLVPPGARYNEEGNALRQLSREEDNKYISADRSSDRKKRLTASAHRTRRDRYNSFFNLLSQEFREQAASRMFTLKRLIREKSQWFSHSPKPLTLVSALIEHCIQPRCLLSPMDADFCAQFLKVMHTQATPGFHTLMCYDKLLGDHVKVVLFSCSEYEARNYGRFLQGILSDNLKWYQDESAYLNDNRSKVNGKDVYHPGLQRVMKQNGSDFEVIKWTEFQQVLRKWHRKLLKCFIDCIQTGEFMHVYNAIVVLKEILPVFPLASVCDTGASLDSAVDTFLETEDRGDLKILGRAYSASLKKRESLWASPKARSKLNVASPKPLTSNNSLPGKTRSPAIPSTLSGPQSQINASDIHRPNLSSNITTSPAPRVQVPNVPSSSSEKVASQAGLSSTKISMESIPRPEVVKRIRPDTKRPDSPNAKLMDHSSTTARTEMLSERQPSVVDAPSMQSVTRFNSPATIEGSRVHTLQKEAQAFNRDPSSSPRPHRSVEDKFSRFEVPPAMPPPSVPSQTASAQELRETARQSIVRPDKAEQSLGGSSPGNRSTSPSSHPGTRNHSSDSRASGGKSRSERGNTDNSDERRTDKDIRSDARDRSSGLNRRDSLTHTRNERRERLREMDKERDGDRERERDRDRDRGRDRHERDREKDRDKDRDRERERDRDRDRDRDRHRRDDKDRDRDSRKDHSSRQPSSASVSQDDRGLPNRPDMSRHRNGPQSVEDGLGKRRRAPDEDPERGSKRSSRKEGHRDDRRRPLEKDSHERNRESDRRRREREENDNEARNMAAEAGDKKTQDGASSTKVLPSSTPSAPRAMSSAGSSSDVSRSKGDTGPGRDRHRDSNHSSPKNTFPNFTNHTPAVQENTPTRGLGSLRSRIGEKEGSHFPPPNVTASYRGDLSRGDEDRDSKKRTASERDKEANDLASAAGGDSGSQQPPKRLRLIRNRYNSSQNNHALARKLLPIDHSAGEKGQRRQD